MSDHNTTPDTATDVNEATDATVLTERRGPNGRLGIITLNRPRAINALTHDMAIQIRAVLEEWARDDDVEAVALTGTGDRGLCAGGDIVAIYDDARTGGTATENFWRDEYHLNAFIASYPKPYVALMDGLVLGGGVGLSAHASHRVVTDRTRIGMPEVGIGFLPDVGGTWLLSNAPGELGTKLALTAGHVDAGDAIAVGLADHYVPAAELGTLLDLLAQLPVDAALDEVTRRAPGSNLLHQQEWIDAAFAHDTVDDILKALTARPEDGAVAARRALSRNSPTSLVVTLRALRSARDVASLEDALDQEYRIAVRLLRSHDFPEGIRAQVVDKDRDPKWHPATVADVDPADVDAYFAPLDDELAAHAHRHEPTSSFAQQGGTA
ncbi:enoyl-CoA hydratase/isomerase family protein [Nocardioides zeicaulis]|uniref:3-hydroxyisobutyryl-CoA hydrolase n=1 Tax=Nocardioides zeicaulis TaxID=1776857 RepID=A0ABV6DWN0_9ACTN